jgi:hypothetical protein
VRTKLKNVLSGKVVDVRLVLGHPARHRDGIRVQLRHVGLMMRQRIPRLCHLGGSDASRFRLEQQIDSALAGLVSATVTHPVRH